MIDICESFFFFQNAFSSFAGFKYPATTSVSSFSFLSEKGEDKNESISKENASNKYAGRPNEFYADLRSLNESVSKWIISHVDDNPSCVLSPVFKDYEKHLASLEKMYPKKEYTSPKVESRTTNATIAETTPSLNISTTVNNGDKDSTETKSPSVKPAFSFNFSRDSNDSNRETSKFKTSIFTSLTSSPAGNITCGLNKDSINSVFGRYVCKYDYLISVLVTTGICITLYNPLKKCLFPFLKRSAIYIWKCEPTSCNINY